jgi:hypothetical protein
VRLGAQLKGAKGSLQPHHSLTGGHTAHSHVSLQLHMGKASSTGELLIGPGEKLRTLITSFILLWRTPC